MKEKFEEKINLNENVQIHADGKDPVSNRKVELKPNLTLNLEVRLLTSVSFLFSLMAG